MNYCCDRLDHPLDRIRLIPDQLPARHRASIKKRHFERRHIDHHLQAITLSLNFLGITNDGEIGLPRDHGGDARGTAADGDCFDLIIRDPDLFQGEAEAKSAAVPGMCTAAVLPFKSLRDLILALPTM